MLERARTFSSTGPVRPLPDASRLSLRIKNGGASAPGPIAGLPLDLPINCCSTLNGRNAARLGPDEWLIIGAPAEVESLRADIGHALADRVHALVDVTQASIGFAVEGPDAANILNAGCPLDLDLRSFPVGSATRTVLGKCETILFRVSKLGFRLECWRSFAAYVDSFLLDAAALNAAGQAH
jgi:sarcosine oxidase, subunit gamma